MLFARELIKSGISRKGIAQSVSMRLEADPQLLGVHTMTFISRFVKNESGATAIEYGLIAAGIAVAIIGVVTTLGTNLTGTFNSVATEMA